jgi:hypothetical protein
VQEIKNNALLRFDHWEELVLNSSVEKVVL